MSPSHPSAGCPQPGLFDRFRSISEQTAHRSRKIRAQSERPPIHVSMFLKLRFHVLRCSRNNTFLRAFVNTLSFFGLRQATQCQRLYSTPATHAPVLVADRSGRPSPSPPRPPTPTGRGPRRRGAGPRSCLVLSLATFPIAEAL